MKKDTLKSLTDRELIGAVNGLNRHKFSDEDLLYEVAARFEAIRPKTLEDMSNAGLIEAIAEDLRCESEDGDVQGGVPDEYVAELLRRFKEIIK